MSIENYIYYVQIYLFIQVYIYIQVYVKFFDFQVFFGERGIFVLGIGIGDEDGGDLCDFFLREVGVIFFYGFVFFGLLFGVFFEVLMLSSGIFLFSVFCCFYNF